MRPLLALGELTSDVTGGDFFIHANKKIKCPINMDDFFRSLAEACALLWRQDATLVDVVLRSLGVSAMADANTWRVLQGSPRGKCTATRGPCHES